MSKVEEYINNWIIGFWDRYEGLCHSRRINPSKVGEKIGVSASTISHWKKINEFDMFDIRGELNYGTMPSVESIIKLADYFNCSTDYLIGMSKHPEHLNRIIDQLSLEKQKQVEEYAELLLLKQKHDEEKKRDEEIKKKYDIKITLNDDL